MIERVRIKNFAIINNLDLTFNPAFNVITGETGAGKSIIVESLSFLFGARFSFKNLDRDVWVEAIFKKDDDKFSIARIYDKLGKSRYFINSKQVQFSEIERLKERLIDFHSQMENLSLFEENYQLSLIDKYYGIEDDVRIFSELFKKRQDLISKFSVLNMSQTEKERLIEIKRFQIEEIEKASLKNGEDIEISEKISNYKNKAKILANLSYIHNIVDGENGVRELILRCLKRSEELMDYGDFVEINNKLQAIFTEVSLLREILMENLSKYNFDENIDELIARDELIKKLKKKYDVLDIKELLSKLEELKKELNNLNSIDLNLESIRKEITEIEKEMNKKASYLTKIRKKAALELSKHVLSVLKEMELKNSRFEIVLEETEEFKISGKDRVEFLFSANPDQPLKPIKYVASGGEISRIMIAIKKVFSGVEGSSVMILDEIDTGVGGNTAFKVAKIIKEISDKTQIICITHLPQIAVFADEHIKITKEIKSGKTFVNVFKLLSETDRIDEIARMFGSDYSKNTAQAHAVELFRKCRK